MTREEIVAGAHEAIEKGSKSFRAASRLFDRTTRERAFVRLASALAPDGVVMLGAGETTVGQTAILAPEKGSTGFHQLAAAPVPRATITAVAARPHGLMSSR